MWLTKQNKPFLLFGQHNIELEAHEINSIVLHLRLLFASMINNWTIFIHIRWLKTWLTFIDFFNEKIAISSIFY